MAQSRQQGGQSTIYKVFNDSVHGHIEMHPLLVKIIDTPEFQRLRNIKQFAGGYYVYPGASHNRFEHSLGVAHLAGMLVQNLTDRQPSLGIKEKDKLCVQIAGLCHDLGHGPFSHAFDDFMDEVKDEHDNEWKHEEQSVKMFKHLINGHIKHVMEEEYKFDENDFTFIEELINPPRNYTITEWPFKGRAPEYSFLYEIVANKLTGIDVDKMDYFSRDCHHLGMTSNFSHERYMMFARVCTDDNGKKQICMRDKEAINMYELFHVRNLIHQRACHHRVAKAVELMITDALIRANGPLKLSEKTIYEAVEDLDTFTHLTDDILQEIQRSESEDLTESQAIIERIQERDLYHFVDGDVFKRNEVKRLNTAKAKKDLLEKWIKKITNPQPNVSSEERQLKEFIDKRTNPQPKFSPTDFRIVFIDLTYGMEESNPVDSLQFYKKNQPDKPYKLNKSKVSNILPETFAETRIMLFYKGLPKKHVKTLWEKLQRSTGGQGSNSDNHSDEPSDDFSGKVSDKPSDDSPGEVSGKVSDKPSDDSPGEVSGKVSDKPSDDSPGERFEEIHIHLTGEDDTTSLSQKVINICESGTYQLFDEKTFKIMYLTSPETWKEKVNDWLREVKRHPDGTNLKLTDFLMVSFEDESNTDLFKIMLFYKGVSKNDVQEFWDLVKEKH